LKRFDAAPRFSTDFEVTHGSTDQPEIGVVRFVRIRREMKAESPLASVLYSLSSDPKGSTETLILKPRESKDKNNDTVQLSIEDSATTGTPSALAATDTPADRIRLERFGKQTIVLARCPNADQAKYGALFPSASALLERYRSEIGARSTFRADIAWLDRTARASSGAHASPRPRTHPAGKNTDKKKP